VPLRQPGELQAMAADQGLEARMRRQPHLVPGLLKADPERDHGLYVAAGADGEQRNAHVNRPSRPAGQVVVPQAPLEPQRQLPDAVVPGSPRQAREPRK
jgi:hypothetical protein